MEFERLTGHMTKALVPHGLSVIGWFSMFDGPPELAGKASAVIGNRGRAMWESFSSSGFLGDGKDHPLDRWTRSVIDPLTEESAAIVLYPFLTDESLDQFWPFQQWVNKATGLQQSPMGMLIDPKYGLWQAFRAVLVFEQEIELPKVSASIHPCDHCMDKPCLAPCPVSAISMTSFQLDACTRHITSSFGSNCRKGGCKARNACPVGAEFTHSTAQLRFHMDAYQRSETYR